jgi:hypothetical protein
MVRRVNVLSSSRLLLTVVCLALCASLARPQSPNSSQRRSAGGSTFIVAPAISLPAEPTSVAVGDVNGDGRPDLVVTTKNSGNITVLLGNGKGGFETGMEYAAGTRPANVRLADLTGSGRLDAIVTDDASGSIEVLAGKGDGSFEKPVSYPAIAHPVAITLGRFGGDGRTDIAVASTKGVALLVSDGSGHFAAPVSIELGKQLEALTAADLRGEGHDDLVAANADGTVTVLLGDGSGHFRALAAVKAGAGALSSVIAGDFNHDGKADIAITHAGASKLTVLLGRGDGTFERGVDYAVGNSPANVIASDVNHDGVLDLIAVNRGANTFSVLVGVGDGTFKTSIDFTAGNSPFALVSGDFDGDGREDLAILNSGDKSISIPLGLGDGTFHAAPAYKTDLEHKAIAAGDLTGAGRQDLVVTNYCGDDASCKGRGTATVFLAKSDGTYEQAGKYSLGSGPVSVSLADVNGDKKLDLIALNQNDKTLTIMPGLGDGKFGEPQTYALAANPRALFVGDLNGDGRPDLAIASDCGRSTCSEPGSLDVWLGQRDGSFTMSRSYSVGYIPAAIAGADLHGTGHLDLIVANTCGDESSCKAHGTATIFAGDGKGKFTEAGKIDLGNAPSAIALANLGGKGLDLVVAERSADRIAVMPSDGKGGFGKPVTYKVGSEPTSLAIADFNGDGKLDVAVANLKTSTVSVLNGAGEGKLNPAATYPVGTGPDALIAIGKGKNGGAGGLVTANGNTGAAAMGANITQLKVHADVNPSPMIALTPSPSPDTVDATETLTAVLTGTAPPGAPTGANVSFSSAVSGAITCGTGSSITADNTTGVTTVVCTTTALQAAPAASPDTITVSFTADANYSAGSQTAPLTVDEAATTTALTTSNNTTKVDSPVTLTATVSPSAGTATVPYSGNITFLDGTGAVAGCTSPVTVNTTTGVAKCVTSSLAEGVHSLTAQYGNDTNANYLGSTSTPATTQTVNIVGTSTGVTFSPSTPTVGQALTITATVAIAGGAAPTVTPGGNVSFSGSLPGCGLGGAVAVPSTSFTATAHGFMATCAVTVSSLTEVNSPYNVTATYSGDGNYATSASSPATSVPVVAAATKTAVTFQPTSPTVDEPVTVTATVSISTGTASVSMGGTVTFSGTIPGCGGGNNNFVQNVTFSGGTATASCTPTASALTATGGTPFTVTATYSGDSNYKTSNSGSQPLAVGKAPTTTTLSSSALSTPVDVAVTLTAVVAPTGQSASVVPHGSVTFTDTTGNGSIPGCTSAVNIGFNSTFNGYIAQCTPTVSSFKAATYQITANYGGDGNYGSSPSNTVAQVVTQQPTTTALTSSANPSSVGQAITITATVIPPAGVTPSVIIGGTVTFTDTTGNGSIAGCTTPANVALNASNAYVATCSPTTSSLPAGSYVITGVYSGDQDYSGSTSPTLTQTVGSATTTTAVTSTASTTTVDVPLTFKATITPTSGNGSISITGFAAFQLDGNVIGTCSSQMVTYNPGPPGTGTAVCTTIVPFGPHNITANYLGNSNNSASAVSGPFAVTVSQAGTTTSIAALPTPSTVDQNVTITASILPNVTPAPSPATNITAFQTTGTVSFTFGGPILGCTNLPITPTGTGATASCQTAALKAGAADSLGASYSGDTNYKNSTATAINQKVNTAATVTGLVSSTNPASLGQSVTFTATVSFVSGAATVPIGGSVAFMNGVTVMTACQTAGQNPPVTFSNVTGNASATCTTNTLAAGNSSITAVYSGDSNYVTSTSSAVTQSIGKDFANTSLASSSPISNVNQTITFSETVATPSGGVIAPTGTVKFTDNSNPIAACPNAVTITSGAASCQTNALAGGTHSIVATYSGDTNYAGNTSFLSQTVNPIASAISLSSTKTPWSVNETVTLTASVTPIGQPVKLSGIVTFTDNNNPIAGCVVPVNATSGQAQCMTSALPVGANSIEAAYASDLSYNASNTSIAQTVKQATTTLDLAVTSMPNPPVVNQPVTFSATVVFPAGATALSGTVMFTDTPAGGTTTTIAGCGAISPASNGTVTCTTSSLVVGSHTITATYANDKNFATSTNSIPLTVDKTSTNTTLRSSSGGTSTVNQAVTFTATVSSTEAGSAKFTGTMTFTLNGTQICSVTVSGTGQAQCPTSALVAPSDTIVATYSNDPSYGGSTTSITQTVNPAQTTTVLTASQPVVVVANPKNLNDAVTLTASVTPFNSSIKLSGSVKFTSNGAPIPSSPEPVTGTDCSNAVPVNPATGQAICSTTALIAPSDAIEAAYGSDGNYNGSESLPLTENVEDYSISISTVAVVVTQGYTTTTDRFSPQTITAAPTPISGFSGTLKLTCTVISLTASTGSAGPACDLGTGTMTIKSSGGQTPVAIVINATHSSPGVYNVVLSGTDEATGLSHPATAPLTVTVRNSPTSLNIESGATTGNTATLDFVLPAGVSLSGFTCASVSGPNLTTNVTPATLDIGCTFNPTSIAASNSVQRATVTITVLTNGSNTAQLENRSTIFAAGLLGIPLLALLGVVRGRKSFRKAIFRALAIVAIGVAGMQTMGCGGSFKSTTTQSQGKTPPGSYFLLIQATGSDHNTYEAVLSVNVTL